MATMSYEVADASRADTEQKERFLVAFENEVAGTRRALRALPEGAIELRPHAHLRSAREVAWVMVLELGMVHRALTTGFDWSNPGPMRVAPTTMREIVAEFDAAQQALALVVDDLDPRELGNPVRFFVGPELLGYITNLDFLCMTLRDQIQHRGQFSLYVRLAKAARMWDADVEGEELFI